MKTFVGACIAAGAMLLASTGTAEAQWGGYYDPYGYGGYGLAPYRTFGYSTTLPGGSVYGYQYVQPNYGGGTFVGPGGTAVNPNAGFSASYYGYSSPYYGYSYPGAYAYPASYYRPGHYTFFDN